MSGVWNHEERTALMVLFEEYPDLTTAERHDIFGRMFNTELQRAGRKYAPQALADQWRQRNAPGRQSKMWLEIDTPSPTGVQQARLANVRHTIITHAARITGANYLTGRQNAPIALGRFTPYTSTRGQAAVPPTASGQGAAGSGRDADDEGDDEEEEEEEEVEDEEGYSAPPAPQTDLQRRGLSIPPDDPIALDMIHRKDIRAELTSSKTYYYDATNGPGPMPKTCPLYRYGGPVIRAECHRIGTFDIMLCDEQACSYCSTPKFLGKNANRRAAEAAEWNWPVADASKSPYLAEGEERGRPFVHSGRDVVVGEGEQVFEPKGVWTRPGTKVVAASVVLDNTPYDPGNKGNPGKKAARKAVVCIKETCEVCKESQE